MINSNFPIDSSSINAVKAKVEILNGSTFVKTCTCSNHLQDFTVNRVGEENKFFGFGICQELKLTLIDLERELNIEKGFKIKVAYGDGTNFDYPYPPFYVEQVERNEENNSIAITAYDKLYRAAEHTVSEIEELNIPFWSLDFVKSCAAVLGLQRVVNGNTPNVLITAQPNFEGTETIRAALDAMAEMNGAIYYLDRYEFITFKQLSVSGDPVFPITKNDYFTLKTSESVTIDAICHATELGNNITYPAEVENGNIQYLRDNPFLENYNDDALVTKLFTLWNWVNGLTINKFICEGWVGNYLLEIGDKISLETEDGSYVVSYVLNDSITFEGTLSETTQWTYETSGAETESNPANLGESLSQTRARVDKVNKQITLMVSEVEGQNDRLSNLEVSTQGISATVTEIQTSTEAAIGTINENFETLSKQVSAKVSANDVQITIETEMKKGVDKVQTSTGFTFNEEGLKVSKSGSEMTTQITEDGMTISRSGQETLVADNTGVKAEDLHAITYLIIGNISRFEDWNGRTGCFWIGG